MADYIPPVGSARYKEYTTAQQLGQTYTPGQGAGTALKTAAGTTGYNYTGPMTGQRYAEYAAAAKLGQKYTPGQAAGTAQAGYNASLVPQFEQTSGLASEPSAASQWTLEGDPVYSQALAGGQSAFNRSRANALADLQNQETMANRQLAGMKQNAAGARRNLAGNYAARGMGRGAYGAYYRAQDQANAADIAAQTSVKDQLASLNQNFLANYGAIGTDWTGTTIGQDYRNQAIQQALAAQLARYGV
jgi:hypothetical protein